MFPLKSVQVMRAGGTVASPKFCELRRFLLSKDLDKHGEKTPSFTGGKTKIRLFGGFYHDGGMSHVSYNN